MKKLVFIMLLLISFAKAEVMFTTVSYHYVPGDKNSWYNNTNPGMFWVGNNKIDPIVGIYLNSYEKLSISGGGVYRINDRISIFGALATGYPKTVIYKGRKFENHSYGGVMPFIGAHVKFTKHIGVIITPMVSTLTLSF